MKNNIKLFLGILIMSISAKSYTQEISAYTFGSIGNIGDRNPQYSGTIQIQGSECFTLANGVKTLQEKNTGEYINNCEVNALSNNMFSLTASPNPILTSTNLKLSKQLFIQKDEKVLLQLINQKGELVLEYTTYLSLLNNGFNFQMTDVLNNGIYFLKASTSDKLFKTLSLIKQN